MLTSGRLRGLEGPDPGLWLFSAIAELIAKSSNLNVTQVGIQSDELNQPYSFSQEFILRRQDSETFNWKLELSEDSEESGGQGGLWARLKCEEAETQWAEKAGGRGWR